ncbi:hypothetical protein Hdeb2414_s0002g00061501 [Helianthus debilis subsp. tardiflorus]
MYIYNRPHGLLFTFPQTFKQTPTKILSLSATQTGGAGGGLRRRRIFRRALFQRAPSPLLISNRPLPPHPLCCSIWLFGAPPQSGGGAASVTRERGRERKREERTGGVVSGGHVSNRWSLSRTGGRFVYPAVHVFIRRVVPVMRKMFVRMMVSDGRRRQRPSELRLSSGGYCYSSLGVV